MIELRVACRKHPRYMGRRVPTASWYKRPVKNPDAPVCPGCQMIYNARRRLDGDNTGLLRPWVKWTVIRSAPK